VYRNGERRCNSLSFLPRDGSVARLHSAALAVVSDGTTWHDVTLPSRQNRATKMERLGTPHLRGMSGTKFFPVSGLLEADETEGEDM